MILYRVCRRPQESIRSLEQAAQGSYGIQKFCGVCVDSIQLTANVVDP